MINNKLITFSLFFVSLILGFATFTLRSYSAGEPSSYAYISASSELGENDWYTSAVTVTIEATAAAGVQSITYWLNSGSPTTINAAQTIQTFPQEGQNTLYFYATDTNGVREVSTNELNFKIDTIAPRSWNNFNADRQGNNHTFDFSINVNDTTSGLSTTSPQVQYSVDNGATFGYYSNLTQCNSTFNLNQWYSLTNQSYANGATSGTLTTPTIDVCNSNWEVCKIIQFRVKDLAGNTAERKICLFGAWMQAANGNVYSEGPISMDSSGAEDNNDAVIFSPNTVSNFTNTTGYISSPYSHDPLNDYSYATLQAKYGSAAQALPSGRLPTTSGWYSYSGNLTVSSSLIPSGFSNNQNLAVVVLVDGNLTIREDIEPHTSSVYMFVVSGRISVDKDVSNLQGIFVSAGEFESSYNGGNNQPQLVIRGAVWADGGFDLSRSLSGNANNNTPAELFTLDPSIYLNQNFATLFTGTSKYIWREVSN